VTSSSCHNTNSDAHNSWEPKENVTAPALLAAYHEWNPAAVRKLETEQAGCSQSTLSLESKERTARTLLREDKCPLDSKRQTDKCPLESKWQSKALDPDNCAQKGNRCIKEETKTQPEGLPWKVTGFVERLRAVLLQPL